MLQFKLKATRLKPDFTDLLLVRAWAGRDERNLKRNLKKQKAEGPVVGAFAQNADIKSLIRKECLA